MLVRTKFCAVKGVDKVALKSASIDPYVWLMLLT